LVECGCPFRREGRDFARLAFMTCLRCEEICRCPSEAQEARWGQPPALSGTAEDGCPDTNTLDTAAPPPASDFHAGSAEVDAAGDSAWRDELSDKLNRYRARRRMPPPRYPSLTLPFNSVAARSAPEPNSDPAFFETVSDQALALDRLAQFSEEVLADVQDPPRAARSGAGLQPPTASPGAAPPVAKSAGAGAKIIEFPRFAWGPPAPPPDQLAEPVVDRLRILEVPEVAPPPPALGGITIEPAQRNETEKQPGIDIPLQSASLVWRVFASLVDGLIVAAASALFGFIFWKVAAARPPLMQMLGLAAGIPCLFWAAYQYLLIVYAGRTVGLRAAGLELTLFSGKSPNRALRRWRVLASYLSAASLGMGYAWVLLDEDSLCWHDRITHTYIAPAKAHLKPGLPRG